MLAQGPKPPPVLDPNNAHHCLVWNTTCGLVRLTPQSPPSASPTCSHVRGPVHRLVPLSCVPPTSQRETPTLCAMYSNSLTWRPLLQCTQLMPRSLER